MVSNTMVKLYTSTCAPNNITHKLSDITQMSVILYVQYMYLDEYILCGLYSSISAFINQTSYLKKLYILRGSRDWYNIHATKSKETSSKKLQLK